MEKTITKLVYDYKDVTSVREGYSINAYEVTIKDGKVQSCRGELKTQTTRCSPSPFMSRQR